MFFLERVCQDILINNSLESVQHLTLILPNKRSELFLKKCFTKREESFILPRFYTFQEFILEVSRLKPLSSLEISLLLYKSWHLKTKGQFESFLKWGPTFIKDMEDVQKALLDSSKVLDELIHINSTQNFFNGQSTQTKVFWKNLKFSYNHFIDSRLKEGRVPIGLIYRDVVKKIEAFLSQAKGKFILIGFNALSKAEEDLFNKILNSGKGDAYWDMDVCLLEQKFQKYGLFFNRYRKEWDYFKKNEPKWIDNNYSKEKNISIRSGNGFMGQASSLKDIFKSNILLSDSKMAIVLNEPQLLLPTISVLEQVGCKANVTMGYPLSYKNALQNHEVSLMEDVKTLLTNLGIDPHKELVKYCYSEMAKKLSVPFDTDSNASVQVMEMLETRLLDFDTVTLLSVNEGSVLPSNRYNSLISFKDRIRLGLPTYLDQEAIYTYHFYRLLHRAKNVHLIYDSSEGIKAKEKSRLISQMEYDNEVNHHISYLPQKGSFLTNEQPKPLVIKKSKNCLNSLRNLVINKGLSQTALTTYFYNPINFYEKYVLKVSKQEPENPISPNILGSEIHKILHELYKPFLGQVLSSKNLEQVKKSVPKTISTHFESQGGLLEGRTYLASKVVERYITQFVDFEITQLKQSKNSITLIALEETYETFLKIDSLGVTAKLYGNIDRVDQVGDEIRIIDYKTGRLSGSNVLKIPNVSQISEEKYFKHFQLLFYVLIFLPNHSEINSVQSGLLFLRNPKKGVCYLENGIDKTSSITQGCLKNFEGFLQSTIKEILSPDIPFIQRQP